MLASLSSFGGNATGIIWPFAAGVLVFLFTAIVIITAIEFIKTLIK